MTDLQYMSQRVLIPRVAGDPVSTFPGYWKGSRRIAVAGCGAGYLYVFMFCRPDDRDAWAEPLDHGLWTASFPHLRDVIERIPTAGDWRPIVEVVTGEWSAGRVALIGDAAHAMAPTLGQGACIAMESGVALARLLDRHDDIEAGLQAWEQGQRPVVDATQRYGRAYIRMLTRWPGPLLDLRSALVWGLSRCGPVQRRLAGTPSAVAADIDEEEARWRAGTTS